MPLLYFGLIYYKAGPSLFTLQNDEGTSFLLLYIDDIIVTGISQLHVSSLILQLFKELL